MTTTMPTDAGCREVAERVADPLRAIDLLNQQLAAARAGCRRREDGLDARRRAAALTRAHTAVVDACERRLQTTVGLVAGADVVVAMHNPWFGDAVLRALAAKGAVGVAVDDGGDALGVAAVEQPAVVVVDHALRRVAGAEVVEQLRRLCPASHVLARGAEREARPLLAAGADDRVPPHATADQVAAVVLARLR